MCAFKPEPKLLKTIHDHTNVAIRKVIARAAKAVRVLKTGPMLGSCLWEMMRKSLNVKYPQAPTQLSINAYIRGLFS